MTKTEAKSKDPSTGYTIRVRVTDAHFWVAHVFRPDGGWGGTAGSDPKTLAPLRSAADARAAGVAMAKRDAAWLASREKQ